MNTKKDTPDEKHISEIMIEEMKALDPTGMKGVPQDNLLAAIDLRQDIEMSQAMLDLLHAGEIEAKDKDGEFVYTVTK
jgi:hypothetical protein